MKNTTYTSESMNFIKDFLDKHPEVKVKQKELRKTWWDRGFVDQEKTQKYEESEIKQDPYVYFSYNKTP